MTQITAGLSKHSTPHFDVAVIYERTIDVAAERERLTKDIAKYEKGLSRSRAPTGQRRIPGQGSGEVVEGLKKQEAETRLLLEKAQAALECTTRGLITDQLITDHCLMDWKSHRIDALLEQALVEDKAASDATTNLTIDPNLRASGSIIAREELVVAGLGAVPRFFEIFARLDPRPAGANAL